MRKSRHFFVSGSVQGVGYRYFARRAAARLHLEGWVKNLRDGRVEIHATGSATDLEEFARELERGPHGAFVSGVHAEDAAVQENHDGRFLVVHDR
jgi:acylphosphatase